MVRTGPRRFRLSGAGCALLMIAALLGGCTRLVTGSMHAGVPDTPAAVPIPFPDMLIAPRRFPAKYPAVVLDPADVARVLREVDGIGVGAVVTPPQCAPPPVTAAESAAVQGVDPDGDASLTVAILRPVPSLRARVDQLGECESFSVVPGADAAESADVTVSLPPAPPVDADDSYAVDQTVRSADGSEFRTLTLVARITDVQVSASWRRQGSEPASETTPDSQALDTVFTDAVLEVRRAIPR